jgi:hypothetical protein
VGVISEDWPAWLEVRPSLEITSLVITYILAWERDQDFIKHRLPGLFPAYLSLHRWTDVYIQSWIWFYLGRPPIRQAKMLLLSCLINCGDLGAR